MAFRNIVKTLAHEGENQRSIPGLEEGTRYSVGKGSLLDEGFSSYRVSTEEDSVFPVYGDGYECSPESMLFDVPFPKVALIGVADRQGNKDPRKENEYDH